MKIKIITTVFINFFVFICFTNAQPTDTNDNKYGGQVDEKTNIQLDSVHDIEQKRMIEAYDLVAEYGIKAKLLEERALKAEPFDSLKSLDIIVPKDAIVYAYNYFKESRYWAIQYNGIWGFVKDDLIFTIHEKDTKVKKQFDEPPKVIKKLKLIYPLKARKAKIEGTVEVKVFIDKNGEITKTIIIEGISELNKAAIGAINSTTYNPAKLNGKPVGVWVSMKIPFKLK